MLPTHLSRGLTVSCAAFVAQAVSVLLMKAGILVWPGADPDVVVLPLIVLVHCVTVFAAWMYKWWAIPYAAPGIILASLIFPGGSQLGLVEEAWVVSLSSLTMAPLGFAMMDWAGINENPTQRLNQKAWRVLVLGGFKASFFGFLLRSAIFNLTHEMQLTAVEGVRSIASEMAGLVFGLVVLMAAFRLMRGLRTS